MMLESMSEICSLSMFTTNSFDLRCHRDHEVHIGKTSLDPNEIIGAD